MIDPSDPIVALLAAIHTEPLALRSLDLAAAALDDGYSADIVVDLLREAAILVANAHPDLGPAGAIEPVLGMIVGQMRDARHASRAMLN